MCYPLLENLQLPTPPIRRLLPIFLAYFNKEPEVRVGGSVILVPGRLR